MIFFRYMVGISFVIAISITSNAIGRTVGERFTEDGKECIVTDIWTDPKSGGEVTTDFCCEKGESLLAENYCVSTGAMQEFFVKSWDFVSGLGVPGFDGSELGPRPPGTPENPTKALCEYWNKDCTRRAASAVKTCEADMKEFYTQTLLNPEPINGELQTPGTCFGEEDAIHNSLWWCSRAAVNRPRDDCRAWFQRVVMENCAGGYSPPAVSEGHTVSVSGNLGGAGSISSGESTTVTYSRAPGEGYRKYCLGKAEEHAGRCVDTHLECLQRAEGISPIKAVRDLDREAEDLIALIDKARLGLSSTEIMTPVAGSFKPIAQNTDSENKLSYVKRLKFLANWSQFIERHGVTGQQQARVQKALGEAQGSFQSAEKRLVRLAANYFFPLPSKGEDGHRLDYLELLRYTAPHLRFKEYDKRMKGTEKALKDTLMQTLGKRRANLFIQQVWTNIYVFGFTAPMNSPQVMAPPS